MRKIFIALIALPFAAFSGAALAGGDAAAGEAKAEVCMDCHEGADFAGMSEDDIAAKVTAHVKGEKKHPKAGNEVAEADIADIAAYWAAEGAKAE